MSGPTVEEPEIGVIVKTGGEAGESEGEGDGAALGGGAWWARRARAGALAGALALYVCALLFVKTMYLRGQRLHRLADMADESEQMMQQVQGVHQRLAFQLEQLEELSGEI